MPSRRTADPIDLAVLHALHRDPDATTLAIAESTGLARNTVRSRLQRYAAEASLHGFDRRIDPAFLGYPLQAYILTKVTQRKLRRVSDELALIPEVLAVHGLSGVSDLLVQAVARDADDLYRVAGKVLAVDGVKRTNTGLVMQSLVDYRVMQLAR